VSGGLEVRGLSKRFGGIVVADAIDLHVPPGRILGLIGPNGAGKTSFFNLAAGVVRPDAGRVVLDGRDVTGLAAYRRARLGLSRTWQNLRLFTSLTVLDNLLVGARRYPAERLAALLLQPRHVHHCEAAARRRAWHVLERMGLTGIAHHELGRLSFGQQKLVGVARALMNEPRCLLLDEPMAGVEGAAYRSIQQAVRALAEDGIAVCVVEHNVAFIRDLCDEGVFMFAGRVLARGSVASLIADSRLTELYFGT
jgi:branched-chain amino acid transport system ATP-binding protein